jgi:Fic-DOC domain mobile mystery protein B
MFDRTWRWAGKFRVTGKNIGAPAAVVPEHLRDLLDDVRYWKEHKTFPRDELAVRFHHRLVKIHPFPNGNGRLGRLATDALMTELGGMQFTWGAGRIDAEGGVRERYLGALRSADDGDISPLLAFVRS